MSSSPETFPASCEAAEASPVAQSPAVASPAITSDEDAPAAGEITFPEDERRGLPSASSFQRYATCPASLPLEFQLRESGQLPVDHGGEESERGDRIHNMLMGLANKNPEASKGHLPAEVEVAEALWNRAQEMITRIFGTDLSEVVFVIEQRIWLQDGHGQPMASGRFDLLAIHERLNKALALDYKSGWKEVPPASINRQLRFGAVCIREAYGVTNVTGVILQPYKPANWADYSDNDIEDALEEIDDVLALKHRDPFEVGFVRGDHCTYCSCRLACPRLQWDKAQLQASPLAILATATDEQIGQFGDALESVKHLEKAWEREAAHRINVGRHIPGWMIASSKGKRTVKDAVGVANLLMAEGAPKDAVLAAMSINVGDAEAIFKNATGLKGKGLAAAFNEQTAGMIEKSIPEPTLKRA